MLQNLPDQMGKSRDKDPFFCEKFTTVYSEKERGDQMPFGTFENSSVLVSEGFPYTGGHNLEAFPSGNKRMGLCLAAKL